MNAVHLRRASLALTALLLWVSTAARADGITAAQYLEPTSRYGHFAAGRPHEYARVAATTASGRRLELQLPDNEVFEDMAPRLVRMAAGEPLELLAIVSRRRDGARLVEQGRCPLPAQVVGAVQVLSAGQVSVGLGSGPHVVRLDDCRAV